ncbi:MAG: hypothetical protein JST87_07125 [Bacteroidetes bacterium]|nr:hypothetical protein [Bacteroidota bacterium]MBS1932712.1 hypothetical protein [Bacteroidota bacterium]
MKIICTAILCTFILSGMAQEHKMYDFVPEATLVIGGSFQNFSGLNNRVENLSQYKKLPGYMGTVELGWLKARNRIVSVAGITLGSSLSGDRHQKSSALSTAGVYAGVGYDVIGSKMITLYPMVGVGYEMYRAKFYRDNSSVDFDQVLQSAAVQNSISPVSFRNGFFTYRAGVGVALHSKRYPANSIGLQAGYVGSFSSNAWRSNENQDLMNAPEDKVSKIYLGVVLAFSPWEMMKGMHGK